MFLLSTGPRTERRPDVGVVAAFLAETLLAVRTLVGPSYAQHAAPGLLLAAGGHTNNRCLRPLQHVVLWQRIGLANARFLYLYMGLVLRLKVLLQKPVN